MKALLFVCLCAAGSIGLAQDLASSLPGSSQATMAPEGRRLLVDLRQYNWHAVLSGTDRTGEQTLTFAVCPLGIFGTDSTTFVAVNDGMEYARLKGGGTCVPGAGGTIRFSLVGRYANPSVGSASSGIQEALTEATAGASGVPKGNFHIVFEPTNPPETNYYTIGEQVNVPAPIGDIDGGGAAINCMARSRCFYFTGWEVTIHGFRPASSVTYSGAPITSTACASNVATITSTLNPGVGDGNIYVDIQLPDQTHYAGIHGPVLSSGPGEFTLRDNNCGWSNHPGDRQRAKSASLGFAAAEHTFIEDNGENLTLRDIMFDQTGLPWARGKLNNGVVVKNDQFFVADAFMAGGGENVNCDENYCGAILYNPGGILNGTTLAGIAYVTNSVFSLQCGGNAINWLSGNVLSIVNSVIQGFQQYGVQAGAPRGNFGPMMAHSVYEEVGGCTNPLWRNAGFRGQAAQSMAGINMLGGYLNLSTQLANGIVGQEPQFAVGGDTTYEYWVVINDGDKTSMPIRFGQATPHDKSDYVIGWPRYVSPTQSPVTYYVLRTGEPGVYFAAPAPGSEAKLSLSKAGSPISQCSKMICTMRDSVASSLYPYTPAKSPSLIPNLWNWSGSVVLGAASLLETDELPVTNLAGIITTNQNVPQVFARRCGAGTPGVYVVCAAGNSSGNNNPAVGSLLLQEGVADGGDQGDLTARLQFFVGPNSSAQATELIGVPADPGSVLADGNHRPKANPRDLWLGIDTGAATAAKSGWAMSSNTSVDMCIGRTPGNCAANYLERLTSSSKTFRVPVTTTAPISSTVETGTPPFKIASTTRVANLTTGGNVLAEDCGPSSTCAKTPLADGFLIRGTVKLSNGGAKITSLPFASAAFICIANDRTTATRGANMLPQTNTTAVVSGNENDTIVFLCMGN